MPRNVKESDDEFETKGGRRTRTTLGSSVLDSPLRRSSRIKQPVNQDGSSPESNGDTSSTGTTRSTRSRTVAADSTISEVPKTLRTRRNSAVSDVSEMTEPESDSGSKRITRRSIASATFVDTPTKLRARPRREIRAGSESISTPPVGRVTRRTRASSMEPETTDEKKLQEIETPVKSRRRASVLPSEPVVVEESNADRSINEHHKIEQIVYEIDEDEPVTKNTSESLRRKSKGDPDDEKMEVDENPVVESKTETMEISLQDNTETTTDISQKKLDDSGQDCDSSMNKDLIDTTDENQSVSSPAKGSSYTIENSLDKSSKSQEKSPGNKENEISNTSGGLIERNFNADVRTNRKSLNSSFANSNETRYNVSIESDQSSNDHCEGKNPTKSPKTIAKDSIDIMAKKVDVDCVVVIEPMTMNKHDQIAPVKTSDTPELSKIRQNQQTPKVIKEETYPLNVENNEIVEKKDATKEGVSSKMSDITIPVTGRDRGEIEGEKINGIEDSTKTMNAESKRGKIVLRRSCSEDTRNDESSKKRSIASAETIIRRFSMDESKKSKENIEPLTSDFAKDRISSIVTESSSSGTKVASKVIDDCNDESSSNGPLSKDEQRRKSDRIAEKLSNNEKNVSELVVFDSDNDSEIVSCKSFKDIPADEWTGNEASKEDNDEEIYSLNLSPVDCNDSESDLLSASKEFSHGTKNKDSKKEQKVTSASKEREMANEETGMEVCNVGTEDQEGDDENEPNLPKKSPKQTSLNKSRNSKSAGDFKMIDTPGKNSSSNSNVSRRKSMNEAANVSNKSISTLDTSKDKVSTPSTKKDDSADDDSDDSADDDSPKSPESPESPEETLNRSTQSRNGRKSSIGMNRSKIEQSNLDSADSQEEMEKSVTDRKSLNNSKIDQSPSDTEIEEAADSPSKLDQSTKSRSGRKSSISMNRSKIDQPSSDSETEENEDSQKYLKSMTPRKSLNISKIGQSPSDSEIEAAADSPSKLNQSAKSQSGRKSSIGMNRSKIHQCNPDSETEENEDSQEQFEKSVISRKSLNNSKIGQSPSDSKIEEAADSPSKLDQSAKSRSGRKSSVSMNRSKIQQLNSDSETEDNEDSHEQFRKSVTPRKSLNNSKIEQSSSDSNIEEDSPSKLNQSAKSQSGRKSSISMNRSKIQQSSSDSETEDNEDSNEEQCKKSAAGRKSLNNSKLAQSLSDSKNEKTADSPSKINRSAKSQSGRKSSASMNQSKIERSILDSESDENEDLREQLKKLDKSASARKSMINDNYSMIAMANSDSDANDNFESNSSESDADVSRKIPRFMFASNSGDSDSDDSQNEDSASINSDVARDMNLDGKSIVEYSDDNVPADDCMATETESSDSDDDGNDLIDFVVDDDDEESEEEEESMENAVAEQKHKKEKLRKRIIPKVMNSSSAESDDGESGPEISAASNDPSKDDIELNESLKNSQLDSPNVGLKSAQLSAKKNKNLLIQSSTPKILSDERSPLEKSKKSPKNDATSSKLETEGSAKKLSKSMLSSTSETPKSGKLGSNHEETKSPKITKLQQSPNRVVEDTNVSPKKTSSSKKKSKVTNLHQTLTTPNTETAETRFLMKEKLNDSLPALKLQQKNESMRRSVLDNLRTENKIEENSHEEEEPIEIETDINAVKKNKKKKKKKNIDTSALDTETKINSPAKVDKDSSKLDASEESLTEKSLKKSKKRKNKKNVEIAREESSATKIVTPTKNIEDSPKFESSQESLEVEEPRKKSKKRKGKKNLEIVQEESSVTQIEEVPKKNKKRKYERIEESIECVEETKRKKKKKQKTDKFVEPEVTTKKQTGYRKTVVLEESTSHEESGQETRRKKKKVDKNVEKTKTSVKRLPDDIIESLPEVTDRPKKRRKIAKEEKIAPSKRMFSPRSKVSTNIDVEEGFISLSSSGSTTQFGVVNMKKTMKKSHKSDTVKTFRERMLARNTREPISAYLVYQQKQKASGRDRIN